ncbi:outer membrane beta-barrel protein [Mucilaginibacter sp. AW1-3]
MNRLLATAALLILLASAGMAQNRANIKGKVVDSLNHEALEFATVAVLDLKDSSLVSYTLTIKGGEFTLHNLPAEKRLKLVVSFVSYQNYRRIFTLDKGALMDMGTIKLSPKGTSLNQVNINAEITPIIMKKDTIEFSAEAFKTPPNAVVEELLRRLPGVQVDIDGTITVNGKKISKLLIDGKQFFANDPKIATRNLDANLIDKVQVYDDRDNDPDHLVPDAQVEKIINLKFKQAIKKSTFGKWRAGYGTEDRFDGGVLYNTFRDTLQLSLIGIGNNLNKTGFSTQDLSSLGGFNRSGNDNLYNGSVATGGRAYGGIQTVGSGGVNINTDYGKKLKINFMYFYSFTDNSYKQTQSAQQLLGADTLSSAATTERNSSSRKSTFSGLVEWNPDTINKFRYTPLVALSSSLSDNSTISSSFNNLAPRLSSNVGIGNGNGDSFQFQHSFSYYHKKKKNGPSLNIVQRLNITPGRDMNYSNDDLTSYTAALVSSDLHRLSDNKNNNIDAGLNITYRYPFNKKITGSISLDNSYNYNNGRTFTFNENMSTGEYNSYIDSLSRNLVRNQFTETIRPELQYQITKKTRLTVNTGVQLMQTNNVFNKNFADIDRRDLFLLPSVQLSVNNFSFNYDENISQPSINSLSPIVTVYSQLYSSTGNPDLKPSRSRNFSVGYSNYIAEKQLSTTFRLSGTLYQNSTFSEQNVSNTGVTFSKPVNKTGNYYAYGYAYLGKGFKKTHNITLRLSTNINLNYNHNFFQVNAQQGYSNTASISVNTQASINWDNKIDINPAYNVSPRLTTYQEVNYSNVKYVPQSLDVPVVVRWPKRYTFEANYTYNYNPLVTNGFQKSSNLLNLAVAHQFMYRDRGEIRVSCYDIFDQNVSSYRYASANYIIDSQSQILKRYFLLSYSYRFSTVNPVKKAVPKP